MYKSYNGKVELSPEAAGSCMCFYKAFSSNVGPTYSERGVSRRSVGGTIFTRVSGRVHYYVSTLEMVERLGTEDGKLGGCSICRGTVAERHERLRGMGHGFSRLCKSCSRRLVGRDRCLALGRRCLLGDRTLGGRVSGLLMSRGLCSGGCGVSRS